MGSQKPETLPRLARIVTLHGLPSEFVPVVKLVPAAVWMITARPVLQGDDIQVGQWQKRAI